MENPLNIRLHIISPVHIGCDDVYEPTSFIIDEQKEKLIKFDPMDFIKSLSHQERQRFTAICMGGDISSIVSIYKFISGRQIKGREIEIAGGLIPHYKKIINIPVSDQRRIRQELNQFVIGRTAYNPHNNLPYIPGSSLKGAIRTAYLSKLAKDKGIERYKGNGKDLEEKLLGGNFATDPFRMIKVSDFMPTVEAKTKVVYAVNKKKRLSDFEARGPFHILEAVKEGAIFEGKINIQEPEQKAGIKNPIRVKDLLKSVNHFYLPIVNKENKVTREIEAGSLVVKRINEKFKGRLGLSAFLIRIGRHSGAEAVTIEGNRYIKIMRQKGHRPDFYDHATTIWLASEKSKPDTNRGLVPFGWGIMDVL